MPSRVGRPEWLDDGDEIRSSPPELDRWRAVWITVVMILAMALFAALVMTVGGGNG